MLTLLLWRRLEYDRDRVVINWAPMTGLFYHRRQGALWRKNHSVDFVLVEVPFPVVLHFDFFQVLLFEILPIEVVAAIHEHLMAGIKLEEEVIAPLVVRKNSRTRIGA